MNTDTSLDDILAGKAVEEVVKRAGTEYEEDLTKALEKLNTDQVQRIHDWTAKNGRGIRNKTTLLLSYLANIHDSVTEKNQHRVLRKELLEQIETSKTQWHRVKPIWPKLGPMFVAEPDLLEMFVPESQKLLCAKGVSDETRAAASDLARNGTRVTIKVTKELIAQYNGAPGKEERTVEPDEVEAESTPTETDNLEPRESIGREDSPNLHETDSFATGQPDSSDVTPELIGHAPVASNQIALSQAQTEPVEDAVAPIATFRGRFVRLIAEPFQSQAIPSLDNLIVDVERFLAKLRRKVSPSVQDHDLPQAG